MHSIPRIYFKMPVITTYFVVIPVFWLLFVLIYEPLGMEEFLGVGKDLYSLNLIITTCILLVVMTLSRMLMFILRRVMDLSWPEYILWMMLEVVIAGLMFSIPLGIGWSGVKPYFSVMIRCVASLAAVIIYPELLITLVAQLVVMASRRTIPEPDDKTLIRFLDSEKRLKLIVSSEQVLYVQAEENYVHIFHIDNGKVKDFSLRSSMRALEEMLPKYGLVRCHRSYFVNPSHVVLVKKDSNGFALAQLDRDSVSPVPVSKRYYDATVQLL